MKRLIRSMAFLGVLTSWATPGHANLIINGSFELPNVSGGGTIGPIGSQLFAGSTELTGWSILTGSVDVVNSSGWAPVDGNQSLGLPGFEPSAGEIAQSFSTTVGASYEVTFEYANHPLSTSGSSALVDVIDGNSASLLSQTLTHYGSTATDMNYTLFTGTFVADSTTSTLELGWQSLGVANDYYGFVVDAVSVVPMASAVPEPTSLWMMSVGVIATLGFVGLRRRRGTEFSAKSG
jgi:Protein of unknown function (DUF642)/PEP-CTERM motif